MNGRISDPALLRKVFRTRLEVLMGRFSYEGIPLLVFETIRSPMRQAALYEKGRNPGTVDYGRTVTRARPYESAHQYGLAADVVFHESGVWTWEEPAPGMWARAVELAGLCQLESLAPLESPHVQWPGFKATNRVKGPTETESWLTWLGDSDS